MNANFDSYFFFLKRKYLTGHITNSKSLIIIKKMETSVNLRRNFFYQVDIKNSFTYFYLRTREMGVE